ncbi:MAG TPA: VWA domain-containing protein, partial [Armatimonadota bacterium]|nr:VWA domain-containing protein [Armatimonadota bacterium]
MKPLRVIATVIFGAALLSSCGEGREAARYSSGDRTTYAPGTAAGATAPAGAPAAPGSAAPSPVASMQKASQSASAQPSAVYNPNLYVANNYIGGTGARDRLDKLVSEGVMVDGKRVRLEAFSRNYAQAFPIPSRTALGVTASTEHGKIVQEGSRTYLQIGLQAMKGEAPRRPPLNIALVMDRSGSMQQENKLVFAKQAATALVASLAPSDTLALVAFDDRAEVLAPAQRVGDGRGIKGQIAALVPGSGTNIYDGLQLGYAEARKNGSPDRSSIVILLSDGEVTSGISDPAEFQRLATESVDRDIQTTTIGMGVE